MALVLYTGKNVLSVGMPGMASDLLRILPGINEIKDDLMDYLKSHPLFQSRIASQAIQIMFEKIGKDGLRPIEDMIKDMPQIFDTKLLKKIVQTDGRERVIKSANEQLERIKNPSKYKEELSNDHFS